MTVNKTTSGEALKLAVACHAKFITYIQEQIAKESTLYGEAMEAEVKNPAAIAMHGAALNTFTDAAKEFRTPPSSDTPNLTHFLKEIERLQSLRVWGRLGDLSHTAQFSVEETPNAVASSLESLGTQAGRARATLALHDWCSLQMVPYLQYLQGA
jgi:hypothetical protein